MKSVLRGISKTYESEEDRENNRHNVDQPIDAREAKLKAENKIERGGAGKSFINISQDELDEMLGG